MKRLIDHPVKLSPAPTEEETKAYILSLVEGRPELTAAVEAGRYLIRDGNVEIYLNEGTIQ